MSSDWETRGEDRTQNDVLPALPALPLIEIIAASRLPVRAGTMPGGDVTSRSGDAAVPQQPGTSVDASTGAGSDGAALEMQRPATGPALVSHPAKADTDPNRVAAPGGREQVERGTNTPSARPASKAEPRSREQHASEQAVAARADASRNANGSIPAASPRGNPSAQGVEHSAAYRVLAANIEGAPEHPAQSRLQAQLSAGRVAPAGPARSVETAPAGPATSLGSIGSDPSTLDAGIAEPDAAAAPQARRRVPVEPIALLRSPAQAPSMDKPEPPASATANGPAAAPAFQPWGQPSVATAPALVEALASHPAFAGAPAGSPAQTTAGHSIKLELHPAELGMVTVSLKMVGEQLSIELNVENEDARSRLSADADSIVKAMRSLGFAVDQVTINQSPVAASPGQGQTAPQAGSQSRDQQPLFSGQSGSGGERAPREGRNGNQGNASATAPTHHSGARGGDVYI